MFTTARGRDAVFWQSPRTRKQARPNVRTPTARAAGIADLQIVVDSHEQYPYRFATQQVTHRQTRAALRRLRADRRRRAGRRAWNANPWPTWSPASPAASCATRSPSSPPCPGPRSWSRTATRSCSNSTTSGPPWSPTGSPNCTSAGRAVPIVFCETRQLAEEWTYRFLAAAHAWAITEHPALQRISPDNPVEATDLDEAPAAPEPSTAEVRAWARGIGLPCPTAADSAPKSGRPGTTPTPRPDIRGPVVGVTHQPRRDGPDAAPDSADLPRNKSTTRVSQQEREAQTTAAVHDSFVRRRQRLCVRQSVGRIGRHTVAVLERDRPRRPATRTQWSCVLCPRISPHLRHGPASAGSPGRGCAEATGSCIGDDDDRDVPAPGDRGHSPRA